MKKIIMAVCLIGMLIIEPTLANMRFSLGLEEPGKISPTEFFLRFLGELRYTAASYVWLNVEIYHHELGLTVMTNRVGAANPKTVGEILGLCRLVTLLDPHFIQAYDLGGWRLAKSLGKFDLGLNFLREGTANNPRSAILNEDVAEIYMFYMKDYAHAIPYFQRSVKLEKDALLEGLNYNLLGHCFEKIGHDRQALEAYREWQAAFPEDARPKSRIKAVLNRSLKPRPLKSR